MKFSKVYSATLIRSEFPVHLSSVLVNRRPLAIDFPCLTPFAIRDRSEYDKVGLQAPYTLA